MGKEDNNRDVHEDLRKLVAEAVVNSKTLKDKRIMQTPQFQEAIESVIQVFEDFAEGKIREPDVLLKTLGQISYPIDVYGAQSTLEKLMNEVSWFDLNFTHPSVETQALIGKHVSEILRGETESKFASKFASEVFKKAINKLEKNRGRWTADFLVLIAEEMRWEHMGY
ncbi:hypothetical protein [Helicobacter salomonis]|uniref:hypothetical protein n=1 Tax=Helicobacter salomonis TaxID=56878 RepID=UPI000CF1AFC7|nr:hypothetical protein [Helicobacter salomonis]